MQRRILGIFAITGIFLATCTTGVLAQADTASAQKTYRPEILKKYDTNGDGTLDKAERTEMKKVRAKRKAKIKQYDTNGDGKLDDQERAAMKEAEKAKHRAEKKKERQAEKKAAKNPAEEESGKKLTFDDLESQDTDKKLAPDEIMMELAADEDDTIILPSINVDQSYVMKDDSTDKNGNTTYTDPWKYSLKFSGQYTFGGPKQNDWALKMTFPLVYDSPGEPTDGTKPKPDIHGIGDISIKVKRAFGITRDLRSSISLKAQLPTAKEGLGSNQYQLQPEMVFSYKPTRAYAGLITFSYAHGFARFDDQPRVGKKPDNIEEDADSIGIKPQVNIALPYKSLFTVNYKAGWKFKAGDTTYIDSAKVKISKKVGNLNVGLGYQKSLSDETSVDSQIDLTCSYNF